MRDVKRSLLTSLPNCGPGISALASAVDILSLPGKSAIANTRTPIPPSHCVRARQNSRDLGIISTLVSMLAPVVVKPDTVSNSAST